MDRRILYKYDYIYCHCTANRICNITIASLVFVLVYSYTVHTSPPLHASAAAIDAYAGFFAKF